MNKPRHPHKTTNPTKKKHISSSSLSSSASSSISSSSSFAPPPNHPSKIAKQPHLSDQRKSYYFTRDLTFNPESRSETRISEKHLPAEPPRKSSRRRRSTKRNRPINTQPPSLVSSSISAGCGCGATLESVRTKAPDSGTPEEYANSPLDDQTSSSEHDSILTEYGSDCGLIAPDTFDDMLSWSTSCECRTANAIGTDLDDNKLFTSDHFDRVSELDHLPPVITKKNEPTKIQRTSAEFSERNAYGSLSVKVVKEDFLNTGTNWSSSKNQAHKTNASPVRRFSGINSSSPGVKLRTNSPRIANRRIQGRKSVSSGSSRRSVSESFAVVKSSKDPRRDFKESMVEMIVQNNIRASKDLEELLACYLSLNSDEYHDLIINVFKQIWFDFIHVRLK